MVGKIISILFVILSATTLSAQVFTYSYIDPCDGKRKYVTVNEPDGSITMSYNTFIKSFKISDFTSGAFEAWINQVKTSIPSTNPCGGVGIETTTSTNTQIAMNTISVATNVVTAVATNVVSSGPSPSEIAGSANQVGTGTDNTSSEGGESDGSSSNETDGTGTDSDGGNTDGEGNNSEEGGNSNREETGDGEGGSSGEAKAAGSSKQKVASVKKGNLIATGDIVAIQNSTTDAQQSFRINASLTYSDSKKVWVYGGLVNFTTSINNSSVTLFGSYRWKKVTTIAANSTMVNFEKDVFNTTTLMVNYPVWKVGTMVGVNATVGTLGTSGFQSLSALAAVNTSIPVDKFNLNIMVVGLYSPYTFYYEGMWYKSNVLAVPFVGVDYNLTRTFKFNVSFTGVYEVSNNVLNYQILLGGKYLF